MPGTVEIWLPVVGYEDHYEVSDQGRIRSRDRRIPHKACGSIKIRGILIRFSKHRGGYLTWKPSVQGDKKTTYVHRTVTEAFLGICPAGQEVRHLNGNVEDVRLVNLTYGTPKENQADRKAHKTDYRSLGLKFKKLTHGQVRDIRSRSNERVADIAMSFGISVRTVSRILAGHGWRVAA